MQYLQQYCDDEGDPEPVGHSNIATSSDIAGDFFSLPGNTTIHNQVEQTKTGLLSNTAANTGPQPQYVQIHALFHMN